MVGVFCAVALAVGGCGGGSEDNANESSASSTTSASPSSSAPQTNARGAFEMSLGEQVEVYGNNGLVLRINDTSLDAEGCGLSHPEVVQAKLAATIETGAEEAPEWLWASDVYYVDANGKVAQNSEVSEAVDASFPCANSDQFIDVPPNSKADGSPTLEIPKVTVAIGYHLKAGGVDQRVEWKLPADWAAKLTPTAPVTTEPAPQAPATDPPAAEAPAGSIPSGWDRDGDGLIDTDAPIGDTGCTTPECLIGQNEQDADEAESGDGYGPNQPLPPLCVRFPDQYDC
ncbi:hypothetical protein C7458_10221 [Williamsia muralis]|nr:hypothetical protein C7458_10221 [Williamsia marianensis]